MGWERWRSLRPRSEPPSPATPRIAPPSRTCKPGISYWFHYANDNPERRAAFDGFGHYEDELVKVDGQWLFSKRRIYNENRKEWAYASGRNPAW